MAEQAVDEELSCLRGGDIGECGTDLDHLGKSKDEDKGKVMAAVVLGQLGEI